MDHVCIVRGIGTEIADVMETEKVYFKTFTEAGEGRDGWSVEGVPVSAPGYVAQL